ncbi:MAG: type II secretion system F family protein [Anaerolineae bacterium]
MNLAAAIAGLAFLMVVMLITGIWWFAATSRRTRDRLRAPLRVTPEADKGILKALGPDADSTWGALVKPFVTLVEQAGYGAGRAGRVLLFMAIFALVGGGAGWFRTGAVMGGVLTALIAGSLPLFYLMYKRYQRLQRFEKQFPDALDMMTRSIRAGHALSGAIQVVSQEMPDPVGQEFRRVFEETRLGMDPGEALSRLQSRVPAQDLGFFCTAIAIQRSAGGSLAEILDGLSEVIRERFKLFSHARVLSTQHRWSAVCIGISPIVFAVMFEWLSPGYFGPMLNSPLWPYLLTAGILFEVTGFFVIWRIAQIKV